MIDRVYSRLRGMAIGERARFEYTAINNGPCPGPAYFFWKAVLRRLRWWMSKPVVYPLEMRWLKGRVMTLEMYLGFANKRIDDLLSENESLKRRIKTKEQL